MTHADLVRLAARWLASKRGAGCAIVATEPTGHFAPKGFERPDAIGWTHDGICHVVEVKTSRADFLRDAKKPHRAGLGLGHSRYYLTPPGLLKPEDVPEGWLLLEATERGVKHGRTGRHVASRTEHETAIATLILVNLLRRATDYQPLALYEADEARRATERERAAAWKAYDRGEGPNPWTIGGESTLTELLDTPHP